MPQLPVICINKRAGIKVAWFTIVITQFVICVIKRLLGMVAKWYDVVNFLGYVIADGIPDLLDEDANGNGILDKDEGKISLLHAPN